MSVTGIIHENSYKLEERFFFFSSGIGTGIGNVQGILSSFDVGEFYRISWCIAFRDRVDRNLKLY